MNVDTIRRAFTRGTLFAVLSLLAGVAFAAHLTRAAPPWQPPSSEVPFAGGPDAFGYRWAETADPGGPVFDWIDISTTGTLVTGLADDNAAAPIALPFSFKFYWTDISSFRVGSNGWIALGNDPAGNIASCFPSIPTAGGAADGYVAPLMSDLNFTGAGNPGQVRYFIDAPNQRLIVSYINVPYWSVNAPGWTGSNTFQVILDAATRSIKFQYQGVSNFTQAAACVDMVGGIEAPQGQIGLQLFNDTQPAGNRAIEFTYPNPPLIDVIDATPTALTGSGLAGAFWFADVAAPLVATISNEGSAPTTSAVNARGRLISAGGATLFDQTVVVGTLAAGASSVVTFTAPPVVAPGHYTFRVEVSGGGDINTANDIAEAELVAVPRGQAATLDYIGAETSNASLNWNGGPTGPDDTGAGVLFVPPGPGYSVSSLGFQMTSNTGGATAKLKLIDNDGPNGAPLTVLAETITPNGPNLSWIDVPIATTRVDADGFYVVWFQPNTTMFLSASTTAPFSRRNVELLSNAYAGYRNNSIQDLFLRARLATDVLFSNGFE